MEEEYHQFGLRSCMVDPSLSANQLDDNEKNLIDFRNELLDCKKNSFYLVCGLVVSCGLIVLSFCSMVCYFVCSRYNTERVIKIGHLLKFDVKKSKIVHSSELIIKTLKLSKLPDFQKFPSKLQNYDLNLPQISNFLLETVGIV